MELYFPGLVKNYKQISALGCLEIVANKREIYLQKKTQLVKKFLTRKINFKIAKFTF